MVTGPLWGRKAWGVYWQWDARLTTSFLLLLTLISYQLARRYGGPAARKLAAALSLFAAVNVPLVYKSVDIWRTIPPKTNYQNVGPADEARILDVIHYHHAGLGRAPGIANAPRGCARSCSEIEARARRSRRGGQPMSGWVPVAVGYGLLWAAVLCILVVVARRIAEANRDLRALERRLEGEARDEQASR